MSKRPDIALLRRYVRGELSPQQMYEIEKAAEADESLMAVLHGVETENTQGLTHDIIPELQQRIRQRSHIPLRRTSSNSYRWIGLAASLLIVLGIGMYIFFPLGNDQQELVLQVPSDGPSSDRMREKSSSLPDDSTTVDRKETAPTKDFEKKLAYSNVEESASHRLKNSSASRKAVLDTIPIQIFPSNAEELVSMSLHDDNPSLIAHNNHQPPHLPKRLSARSGRQARSSTDVQSVSLGEIKSITTGIIIDRQTQKPIAGAVIQDQEMNTLAKTDSTGRFVVGSTSEKPILRIQSDGFVTTDQVADGAMRIALRRANNAKSIRASNLSERTAKLTQSRPAVGFKAYQLYVNNVAKASALGSGEVRLQFEINTKGRPTNIAIKNSGGKRRDKEAIKIIENGPNWIQGSDLEPVEWTIQF